MKFPIIATVLLVIASQPAVASSAAIWDCGNGAQVSSNRGELGASVRDKFNEMGQPRRGSHSFNLTWDLRGGKDKVWLNGKLCKRSN